MKLILAGALAMAAAVALSGQGTVAPPGAKPTMPPAAPPIATPKAPQRPGTNTALTPKPGGPAIAGVVVDPDGRAVVEAAVWLVGTASMQAAQTDSRGRFGFSSIVPGEYMVIARKRGFYDGAFGKRRVSGTPLPVTLSAGQGLNDMRIELFRSGVIAGSIVDEANEPVIGARVLALRRVFANGQWQYVSAETGLTDDQGMYRLYGLLPGEYYVTTPTTQANLDSPEEGLSAAQLPYTERPDFAYPTLFYPSTRYSLLALPIDVGSGEIKYAVNFRWTPVPARAVSGNLVGEAGIADQIVRLVPLGQEISVGNESAVTKSTADGGFSFERVPAGEYRIEAGGAFGPPKIVDVTVAAQAAADFDLYWGRAAINVGEEDLRDVAVRMTPGHSVSGVIVKPSSKAEVPVDRISVVLIPAEPGLSRATTPALGPDGKFMTAPLVPGSYNVLVTGLPAGWYLRSITSDAIEMPSDSLVIGSRDVTDLKISLTDRPTVIQGSVRDSRMQAASGAAVVVWSAAASGMPHRSRQTRASTNGQFAIAGLPAGEYYIVAFDDAVAEGWQDVRMGSQLRTLATRLTVRDDQTQTVHLRVSAVKR